MTAEAGLLYLIGLGIGLGPGDSRYLAPAALAALESCDVVVGYRAYIEQRQLLEARDILLRHRDPATPVGIVGDAFRPEQRVTITSLDGLAGHAESVDMVPIVLVGNSATYVHSGRVITPRGYEEKSSANRPP